MNLFTIQSLLIAATLLHSTKQGAVEDFENAGKSAVQFLNAAKPKFDSFMEKVKDFNNKVSAVDKTKFDEVTGVAGAVAGGALQLANGIINGKWQDMIVGALGLIGGLASLAGPYGVILSAALSVISQLFGLFGGDQKAEESQEAMLKRIINEALANARAEELKADAEGLKKLMLSIRNSISQFRESGVTEEQANELYTQVFTGLDFFGKLKYEINKFCDCSAGNSEKGKEREQALLNADKCLQFLNLYSDLSIYRLLIIINMASLFSSFDKSSSNGINKIGDMVYYLGEKERASDREILMFLFDPINNIQQRFCISQYHAAPSKYPTIMAYTGLLISLFKKNKTPQDVTVCSEMELLGVCYNLNIQSQTQSQLFSSNDLHGWESSIKSIYVSDSYKVAGWTSDKFTGTMYGWYFGPTVIGKVYDKEKELWKSIKVEKSKPTENSHKMVRLCKGENFEQNELCHQVPIHATGGTGAFTNLDELSVKFEKSIKSVMIPEGLQVEFYSEKNKRGNKFGPFYGPNAIDDFCQQENVVSVVVSPISTTVKVSDLVKICKGLMFSLQCEYLEVKDYPQMVINGCNYSAKEQKYLISKNTPEVKVRSMVIPAGLKVLMWTKPDYKGLELGSYTGPLSLPAIEGLNSELKVMSLKIVKV